MKQGRLDALADGIFAIVMTILVFQIQVPEIYGVADNQTVAQLIISLYPLLLTYLLSFSLLFTYWRAHQYIASVLARSTDIPLSNLSALFFFFVGLVPFSSQLLGSYHYTQVAILVFGANIILVGLSLWIMRHYVIASHDVKNAPFTPVENQHANIRILFPVFVSVIAILVSFFNTDIALGLFTIGIFFNLSRRSTRYVCYILDIFK